MRLLQDGVVAALAAIGLTAVIFLLVSAIAATTLAILIGRRVVLPVLVSVWRYGRRHALPAHQPAVN